jgi:copper chaperone CopZ
MTKANGKATAILKIQGMDNPGRAQKLRRALEELDGVIQVDINYISDTSTIRYDADRLTLADVKVLHQPHSTPPIEGVVEPREISSRDLALRKEREGRNQREFATAREIQ